MARFFIENFGCRATAADAALIERQLLEAGYARAGDRAAADVVVLNTCTVTAAADAEARKVIRIAHNENPAVQIVVTGCYAQRAPEDVAQVAGVSLVVGVAQQSQIPQLVAQTALRVSHSDRPPAANLVQIGGASAAQAPLAAPSARIVTGDVFNVHTVASGLVDGELAQGQDDGETSIHTGHTRPVLKIQDGCNNRCAYCILPFVRGNSRSLAPVAVVAEISRLCAAGRKEIVLSGINLGAWGRDLAPRVELLDLLRRILDETPLERLRLSSIEPMDVTQDLVDFVAEHPRMARHFHIPLQSGSDRVLAAMHRWYRTAHYARRIEMIRERIPGAGVGADLLAGFPGETEADHAETVALVERLPFTYLHIFSFSSRPGTEAARQIQAAGASQVPAHVIRKRARELREIAARKAAAFRAAQQGVALRVLTLHTRGQDARGPWTQAISDNYLTLRLPGTLAANEWKETAAPR